MDGRGDDQSLALVHRPAAIFAERANMATPPVQDSRWGLGRDLSPVVVLARFNSGCSPTRRLVEVSA